MHPEQVILAAAVGAVSSSLTTTTTPPSCHDFTIPISVEATASQKFGADIGYSAEVLYALAGKKILVSNTYDISARLCVPTTTDGDDVETDKPIQLLVHGATFNKNMWDVPYQPDKYNWIHRMTGQEGYPTLAIDLPGNGNSTFPDALLESQTQTYVESVHQVIRKMRTTDEVGGRQWDKIVFVGFSIGAIAANSLAAQHPEDSDAIVLHGISWDPSWIYPAFLAGLQAPAQQVDPEKWGHLEPFYQTQSTREGRLAACFAGEYDPGAVELDW